jgi:hypothetical protein
MLDRGKVELQTKLISFFTHKYIGSPFGVGVVVVLSERMLRLINEKIQDMNGINFHLLQTIKAIF